MSLEDAKPVREIDKISWIPYVSVLTFYDLGIGIQAYQAVLRKERQGYTGEFLNKRIIKLEKLSIDITTDAIMRMQHGMTK